MNETSFQKWCDQVWLYVVYFLGIFMACLIRMPFAVSIRVKSPKFAFRDKGYFEKYEPSASGIDYKNED